jgi:hypothetical protein
MGFAAAARASIRVAAFVLKFPFPGVLLTPAPRCPLPNQVSSLGIVTTTRIASTLNLGRCPSILPLRILNSPFFTTSVIRSIPNSEHSKPWPSRVRGLAKVCRAQTKFSAFQQPCYRTSLKLRATGKKLTSDGGHYSTTWPYIAPQKNSRITAIGAWSRVVFSTLTVPELRTSLHLTLE